MGNELTNMERYNMERKELANNRKKIVLDKSQELFLRNGLANVTMNDIMIESGVSKATLYRYFSSIEPIAFEIEYRMLNEIAANTFFMTNNDFTIEEAIYRSLLIMIDEFNEHKLAYKYISMFDNLYCEEYPSEDLFNNYKQFFDSKSVLKDVQQKQEEYCKIATLTNMTLSFLQKLATRGKLLEKHQGISADEQLKEFRKIIEKEVEQVVKK